MEIVQKQKNKKRLGKDEQKEGKDVSLSCRGPRLPRCLQGYLEYFRDIVDCRDENK